MLYACVLEAQSSGDRAQAVHALQRVVNNFEYHAPDGVHLPSLLRYALSLLCYMTCPVDEQSCTARLLEADITSDPSDSTDAPEKLVALFERGRSICFRF